MLQIANHFTLALPIDFHSASSKLVNMCYTKWLTHSKEIVWWRKLSNTVNIIFIYYHVMMIQKLPETKGMELVYYIWTTLKTENCIQEYLKYQDCPKLLNNKWKEQSGWCAITLSVCDCSRAGMNMAGRRKWEQFGLEPEVRRIQSATRVILRYTNNRHLEIFDLKNYYDTICTGV